MKQKLPVYLTLIAASSFALASCDVDQTEELKVPDVDVDADAGELPEVEVTKEGEMPSVDVDAKGGNLPEFDVDTADVDVEMKEKKVTVPVPDVDVDMPKEDEPDGDPIKPKASSKSTEGGSAPSSSPGSTNPEANQ